MTMTLPTPDFSRLAPPAGYRLAITGGCGGIGRRLTEVAVAEGMKVAVIDLPASLERHAAPEGVLKIPYDAREDDSAAQAFETLAGAWDGALDGLVHLPGYMPPPRPIEDLSAGEIDEALSVNLRSAFLAVKAALPMLRRGAGETGHASGMVFAASGLATLVEKEHRHLFGGQGRPDRARQGAGEGECAGRPGQLHRAGCGRYRLSARRHRARRGCRADERTRIFPPAWTTAPCWRRSRSAASP